VLNVGYFLSFDDALLLVIRDSLPMLLLFVSIASIWTSSAQTPEESPFTIISARAFEALGLRGNNTYSPRKNDLLLGLREPFLWFLAPLFVIVCVGVTVVVSKVVFMITVAFTALWNRIPLFPWMGAVQWLDRTAPLAARMFRKSGSWVGTD